MIIHIGEAEARFYQAERAFDSEYTKMQEDHQNRVQDKGMTTSLITLLDQRLENITNKFRDIYTYRANFYLRTPYGQMDHMTSTTTKNNAFFSSLITNRTHGLNGEQIKLLSRGPTYVLPCQMSIANNPSLSKDDIVKKQFAPLQHQLATIFSKHYPNMALSWTLTTNIRQLFSNRFALDIPSDILRRATHEKKLVQSIRQSLTKQNLLLRRTADHQNTFYLAHKEEFETKASTYLSTSDVHEVLFTTIDNEDDYVRQVKKYLHDKIKDLNASLDILKGRKALNDDVIQQLTLDEKQVKLPYLYFLPDVSKVRHDSCHVLRCISFFSLCYFYCLE